MSAPVLSLSQKKRSLSGLKSKNRKVYKQILIAPDNIRIRNPNVEPEKTKAVIKVLERLLPSARLPVVKNSKSTADAQKIHVDTTEIRAKRNQLLIGVNVVSKAVKNEIATCILFADDIEPKILIGHLLLLCNIKKIPYIFMPNFRNLTKNTLGHSCIVLGFKKNFSDFDSAVSAIKSAVGNEKSCDEETGVQDVIPKPFESVSCEKFESEEKYENKFTYLYRSSNSKRVFVPDPEINDGKAEDSVEFISIRDTNESEIIVKDSDGEEKVQPVRFFAKKLAHKTCEKISDVMSGKRKVKQSYLNPNTKKRKLVDANYFASKVLKMESNPNREKKKFQKLKKKC